MPRHSEFVAFVLEQMVLFGKPRVRAMFGGYGLYQDDCMFAIVVEDHLYFKVSSMTQSEFEAKGLRPFSYIARGKSVTMSYFEAPAEVFEDPEAMQMWAQKACQAALSSKKTGAALR